MTLKKEEPVPGSAGGNGLKDLSTLGRIAVVANQSHPERHFATEDEEAEFAGRDTLLAIRDALIRAGADAVILEAGPGLPDDLRREKIRFVFNLAEGRGGRDREAQVPALLSLMGIPYSGADALVLSVTLDKDLCKRVAASYGIRTAPSLLVAPGGEDGLPALEYPVIVKPNAEGSGKGITEKSVARNEEELRSMLKSLFASYPQQMLVEPYLPGREFTVGILGNGEDMRVFPPMEVVYRHPTQDEFFVYSYRIKKDYRKHVDYVCPAEIPEEASRAMTDAAGTLYRALGCVDFARVDFRMDAQGRPCFLEMNPLPGLAPDYSDYPMAAEAVGYAYDDLIASIAECAAKRWFPEGGGMKDENP